LIWFASVGRHFDRLGILTLERAFGGHEAEQMRKRRKPVSLRDLPNLVGQAGQIVRRRLLLGHPRLLSARNRMREHHPHQGTGV
jgi:hypothetical protein